MNTYATIEAYRSKYGIREATEDELSQMTPHQRDRYHACGLKPHGVHYENFRVEGQSVRPLYLEPCGIGDGNKGFNLAQLAPFPLFFDTSSDASKAFVWTPATKIQSNE